MKSITTQQLTHALRQIYDIWYNAPAVPTIYDMVVLNHLLCCYDNDHNCGIKELCAELSMSKGTASKILKKCLKHDLIKTKVTPTDRRRKYYLPAELLLTSRQSALDRFREALSNT